jgi:hypothetical protein
MKSLERPFREGDPVFGGRLVRCLEISSEHFPQEDTSSAWAQKILALAVAHRFPEVLAAAQQVESVLSVEPQMAHIAARSRVSPKITNARIAG